MNRIVLRRSAAGLALGALAATGLASVAAPAHAVITNGYLYTNTSLDADTDACTVTTPAADPANVPFTDNGVATSQQHSVTGTATSKTTPTDVTDLASSAAMTVTATPIGSGPSTVTGSATVAAKATAKIATTECDASAYAGVSATGEFTLAQPMWVTVKVDNTADASGYVGVRAGQSGNFRRVQALVGDGYFRSTATSTALLPAGPAQVNIGAGTWAGVGQNDPHSSSDKLTYSIEFQPLGAASAVSGKGGKYVALGARNCATGNIDAALTKKAKKKAKEVLIKVNGTKAAKFKGKKLKKRSLVLPAASSSAAEVVATIKLKNGKTVTVTRSYLACS